MGEEASVPGAVATGALATIADYTSESEHEEIRDLDAKTSDEVVIEKIISSTANEEVVSEPATKPDFEIEIQDDADESTHQTNENDVAMVDKDYVAAPISNPFAIRERVEIEDFCSDDELPALNISDDDSDVEFNRILDYTAKQRKKDHDRAMGLVPTKRIRNDLNKDLEREYDKLPPMENLTISCQENIPMRKLGSVKHIVDCLVVIEADSGLAIDYESVIFREDRSALGRVFDIFGAVRCPSYSIRFNSEKEARGAAIEGLSVFVADTEEFTRKIITENLNKEKHTDGALVLNSKGEEEDLYSDDEAEQNASRNGNSGRGRGRGNKRTRGGRGGGGGGHFNQSKMSWPPNQRGRGRGGYNQYSSPYANGGGGGPPMIDTRYMGGI